MFTIIGLNLFQKQQQRQKKLALYAEEMAGKLSRLSSISKGTAKRDLESILQNTCSLLEPLVEATKRAEKTIQASDETRNEVTPVKSPEEVVQEAELLISGPTHYASTTGQPELSETAKELIQVSDWVLFAKIGATAVEPAVLEEIHRQLTRTLAKEHVLVLTATGTYDYERQMVVGTRPTHDSMLVNQVHSTVRPGYLFHEQVVRPQEVIVYVAGKEEDRDVKDNTHPEVINSEVVHNEEEI